MAFEGLSEKLNAVFKSLRGKGRLTESDVRFRDLIKDLGKDSIVLLSTHIVSDIEHIADDILMMKSGQLIYQGKWTDKSGNLEEFYLKQFEEIE